MLKKCKKCGNGGDFYKDAQKADGLDSWCKPCRKKSSTSTRNNNLDTVRAYDRARRYPRYLANKDYENNRNSKWVRQNYERLKPILKRGRYKRRSRLYGISHECFLSILIMQQYKCQICRIDILDRKDQHIDHNHQTKQVRGILCAKCNRGIGHFNDDPDLLLVAVAYLRGYSDTF